MNVYAKFHCALLRIKKALEIFRELITTTTRVAVRDPPSGSKNSSSSHALQLYVSVMINRVCGCRRMRT